MRCSRKHRAKEGKAARSWPARSLDGVQVVSGIQGLSYTAQSTSPLWGGQRRRKHSAQHVFSPQHNREPPPHELATINATTFPRRCANTANQPLSADRNAIYFTSAVYHAADRYPIYLHVRHGPCPPSASGQGNSLHPPALELQRFFQEGGRELGKLSGDLFQRHPRPPLLLEVEPAGLETKKQTGENAGQNTPIQYCASVRSHRPLTNSHGFTDRKLPKRVVFGYTSSREG